MLKWCKNLFAKSSDAAKSTCVVAIAFGKYLKQDESQSGFLLELGKEGGGSDVHIYFSCFVAFLFLPKETTVEVASGWVCLIQVFLETLCNILIVQLVV